MKQKKQMVLGVLAMAMGVWISCQTVPHSTAPAADAMIQSYLTLSTSSVSDAIDQVLGQRGYMSHTIRPLFPVKMCGYAVTVLAQPTDEKVPPSMALDLIDTTAPGHVLVIVMDGPDGADVAAFGGIMGTGAQARQFAGAVLDGGCRDALQLEEMGFPVFTKSIVPTNSVGRYKNVAKNTPVVCGGIPVEPGDVVLGDGDGVVVVPKAHAAAVLRLALELEAKEAQTMEDVKALRSIRKASEKNQRI